MTTIPRVAVPATNLFIDGEWRAASDGSTFEVIAPATGEHLATVAAATIDDVNTAVASARAALRQGAWAELDGAGRGKLLWRLADLVEANIDELALLEAADVGRAISESRYGEMPLVVDTLRHFAGWADKLTGETFALPPFGGAERFSYTLRQPLGVIAAITPWNAPTMITSWKLAPALAAGNVVILKPAQEAPLTALRLAELSVEAGFPPGVITVLPGAGRVAGATLASHPGVDKVSFTGSSEVGRGIAAAAAPQLSKLTLELGGKSPQIVWPDANLDQVIPVAAMSVFVNAGQVCASGSRIYVHRSIIDEFAERLAAHAASITIGAPEDPATQLGSLVSEKQLTTVLSYITSARTEGAQLVCGGNRHGARGFYVEPTVFIGTDAMTIAQEEIFGPVATLIPFDDDDAVLDAANGTEYGLTAVLWTDSATRINRFTKALDVGVVWVNAWGPPHPALPWLGAKASGIGEELGLAGLHAVTRIKSVNVLSS